MLPRKEQHNNFCTNRVLASFYCVLLYVCKDLYVYDFNPSGFGVTIQAGIICLQMTDDKQNYAIMHNKSLQAIQKIYKTKHTKHKQLLAY